MKNGKDIRECVVIRDYLLQVGNVDVQSYC